MKWSARSWGIGALLSLPVFDGGRREAGVQSASAQLDGALANYRAQVLVAFKEVEDQLSSLRLLRRSSPACRRKAVASAERATTLSDSRYRNGMVSQLDLLDARRSELQNRRAGAAGEVGAVPGDGGLDPRAGRQLGRTGGGARAAGRPAGAGRGALSGPGPRRSAPDGRPWKALCAQPSGSASLRSWCAPITSAFA